MPACLQAFFDAHFSTLISGDLTDFVSEYDYPLALYVEGDMVVYPSPVTMLEATRAYRHWLIASGVSSYTCRINAVDIPRQGRFRVWVSILAHHAGDGTSSQTESIYFLREKRGQLLIEMVDCTETADTAFVRSRRVKMRAG